MTYVYKRTDRELWTVGYFDQDGEWRPESDHRSTAEARARADLLNNGTPAGGGLSDAGLQRAWRTFMGMPYAPGLFPTARDKFTPEALLDAVDKLAMRLVDVALESATRDGELERLRELIRGGQALMRELLPASGP